MTTDRSTVRTHAGRELSGNHNEIILPNGFYKKQEALDAVKEILSHHLRSDEISAVTVIAHIISPNKGMLRINGNGGSDTPLKVIDFSVIETKTYSITEFMALTELPKLGSNEVWSMTSRVLCGGRIMHLPMLDIRTLADIGINDKITLTKEAVSEVFGKEKTGVLLDSGRSLHYYGDFLLGQEEWLSKMKEFLNYPKIVNEIYIACSEYEGRARLRLTTDEVSKPNVPKVVAVV